MNKKTILTLALAFCLVLTLGVGSANAGPSQYYFDDFDCVYAEVADIGMIYQSNWQILVKVPLYSTSDISLGLSSYNTTSNALCLHVDNYGMWLSHSYEGVWGGSGTQFRLAIQSLVTELRYLYTRPPASLASAGADATVQ